MIHVVPANPDILPAGEWFLDDDAAQYTIHDDGDLTISIVNSKGERVAAAAWARGTWALAQYVTKP